MNEIWKDIEGYEGLYQVSNLGRIKSLSRITTSHKRSVYQTKEMIMKYKKSRDYNSIGLSKYGNTKYYRVARLVASAFIPNPDNLPQVNHKDCNKRNDYASNLEWCDAKYNCNYADHNKKLSIAAKKRFQDPIQYEKQLEIVRRNAASTLWREKQRIAQMKNSNCKKVLQLNMNGEVLQSFLSSKEAERVLGIKAQNIGQVCLGRKVQTGGYKWRYAE